MLFRPPESKYLKAAVGGGARKTLYVIEAFFEWISHARFGVVKIFRERLKEIIREASENIKYVIMSSNPNEQYLFAAMVELSIFCTGYLGRR